MQRTSIVVLILALQSTVAGAAIIESQPVVPGDSGTDHAYTRHPAMPSPSHLVGQAIDQTRVIATLPGAPASAAAPGAASLVVTPATESAEVPLPPAIWLFAAAILGFAGFVTRPGG